MKIGKIKNELEEIADEFNKEEEVIMFDAMNTYHHITTTLCKGIDKKYAEHAVYHMLRGQYTHSKNSELKRTTKLANDEGNLYENR